MEHALQRAEELDPLIRDVVMALREAGFRTFSSCQGGSGHAFSAPTILMLADESGTVETTQARLRNWLVARNVSGYAIKCHYQYGAVQHSPTDTFLELEFWGLECLPKLAAS